MKKLLVFGVLLVAVLTFFCSEFISDEKNTISSSTDDMKLKQNNDDDLDLILDGKVIQIKPHDSIIIEILINNPSKIVVKASNIIFFKVESSSNPGETYLVSGAIDYIITECNIKDGVVSAPVLNDISGDFTVQPVIEGIAALEIYPMGGDDDPPEEPIDCTSDQQCIDGMPPFPGMHRRCVDGSCQYTINV